jgi:hypothetical protein
MIMPGAPNPDDLLMNVRPTDPDTSREAARDNGENHWTDRHRLLIAWAYAGPEGLTDEEAADKAGLMDRCYWKRSGENRQPRRGGTEFDALAGGPLVEFSRDGRKRKGRSGSQRKVSVLTRRGYDYLVAQRLVAPPLLPRWWGTEDGSEDGGDR